MHLRWCDSCGVPVVKLRECGTCGSGTRAVEYTPPGDVRPAFPVDVELFLELIGSSFGVSLCEPEKLGPVVLNSVPSADRMDEVIVNGVVVAAIRYDPEKGYSILPRPELALAIEPKRRWVIADQGAVGPIAGGANLLAPGVTSADPDIMPDDDVIILSDGKVLGVGRSRFSGEDLNRAQQDGLRGMAIKIRWKTEDREPMGTDNEATWEDAVAANIPHLEERLDKGMRFAVEVAERKGLPVAVSFSGGKDSLVTLDIVAQAGLDPTMMFLDTGLELPGTLEYVEKVAARYGLPLIVGNAYDAFWKALEHFGPPAKDFRWCCKTNKLGPTSLVIREHFPDGVLSFIGQRQYESQQRKSSGPVWRNPWVIGQTGASPIQGWTSFEVWLYIFWKDLPFNPWYEQGLDRIGCWLCPASDVAELERVKEVFPGFSRWSAHLTEYADEIGTSADWLENGLWRWRKRPGHVEEHGGLDIERYRERHGKGPYGPLPDLDRERYAGMLSMLGAVDPEETGLVLGYDGTEYHIRMTEGGIDIDPEPPGHVARDIGHLLLRSAYCVGCGVCVAACPSAALEKVENLMEIDSERCSQCGRCLDAPCPVIEYRPWSNVYR